VLYNAGLLAFVAISICLS